MPALLDQNSQRRTLADLGGQKGVLLVFHRSAGWCPFCQVQLIALSQGAAQIEQRGFRLAALSYDEPAVLKSFADRRSITYPLLSDPRSEVIDRWGLRDPQYPPGNRAHGVPRPIIFAIDRRNVIVASIAEERYQDRPPVDVILKTLDSIRA